jgi:phosphoheptose isomerase
MTAGQDLQIQDAASQRGVMNEMQVTRVQTCVPSQAQRAARYFQLYPDMMNLTYDAIEQGTQELLRGYENQKRIFLFGNGGVRLSPLISHVIYGREPWYGNNKKRFRVLALTDNLPLMTAWANDISYECGC